MRNSQQQPQILHVKKFTLKLDCTFLQSATSQKTVHTMTYPTTQKSNIWDFMSGSHKACSRNVNLKNTISELWPSMLVQHLAIPFLSTKNILIWF